MHCGLGRMSRLLAVLALHGSGEMLYEQWIKSLECNRGVFGTIMCTCARALFTKKLILLLLQISIIFAHLLHVTVSVDSTSLNRDE